MAIQGKRSHQLAKLEFNSVGKDYVVGDLHGQYDLLMEELLRTGFDRRCDRLICAGDMVDRGPQSVECLKLLREPWFFSVLGNHEDMMINSLIDLDLEAAFHWVERCGGRWIRDADSDLVGDLTRDFLLSLPLALEVPVAGGVVGVIHASVTSGRWGQFQKEQDIWNRRIAKRASCSDQAPPKEAVVDGIDAVVVGHNITERPLVRGNTLLLDTGAALGCLPAVWPVGEALRAVKQHARTGQPVTFFSARNQSLIEHG